MAVVKKCRGYLDLPELVMVRKEESTRKNKIIARYDIAPAPPALATKRAIATVCRPKRR